MPRGNIVIDEDFFDDHEGAGHTYSPTRRRTTRQHRRLITHFSGPGETRSQRALHACLECLATNTWSEAWCVGVTDGGSAFCVVYRYGNSPRTLGIRVTVDGDPGQFGQEVATGDIGEPLGTVARHLRPDPAGIHWWGNLNESLPVKPRARPAPALQKSILAEMRAVRDWVSVADVLKVMGTTSFVADRADVRAVLDCVDASERLRLGRVGERFEEIGKPLPVAALVDRIFAENGPADRSAAMMELFIDDTGDVWGAPDPGR